MSLDVLADKNYSRSHFSACDRPMYLAKGLVLCLQWREVSILVDAPSSPGHGPKQPLQLPCWPCWGPTVAGLEMGKDGRAINKGRVRQSL